MHYPFLAAPSFLRPVAIFAGVSSSIQALAYITLTTLGILVYQCKLNVENQLGGFNKCIVEMYFHDADTCGPRSGIFADLLSPETTLAWMITYLVVDCIWLVISIAFVVLLIAFQEKCMFALFAWSSFSMCVCCKDLAGIVYYALQLQEVTIKGAMFAGNGNQALVETLCSDLNTMVLVPGLLMSIAGRFYIFWLSNAALTLLIGVCAIGVYNKAAEDQNFLQNSATSPFFFEPAESVNSIAFGRRPSIIEAWKSSWRDAPPVRIPKVDPSKKHPFSQHGSAPSSIADSSYVHRPRKSFTIPEESLEPSSPVSIVPQQLPSSSRDPPERERRQKALPPLRRHPPPPPDLKPLRSALKTTDDSRTAF